jgi:hypothetical protein
MCFAAHHDPQSALQARACAFVVVVAVGLALAGCSKTVTEGIQMTVQGAAPVEPASVQGVSGSTRTWQTPLGYQVVVSKMYLNFGGAELIACEEEQSAVRKYWKRCKDWASISVARAHTESSLTRLGTPVVESMLRADGSIVELGVFGPPPGAYCVTRYFVDPADEDAQNLPADAPMLGKTVYVEGTYQEGTEPPAAFVIATSLKFDVLAPGIDIPKDPNFRKTLRVARDAVHWFDEVDFRSADVSGQERALVRAMQASTTLEFVDGPVP